MKEHIYEIRRGSLQNIDTIQPLWEKLNKIHADVSVDFSKRFQHMGWQSRKEKLIQKSSALMFDYVIESTSESVIGYCISTVEKDNQKAGEIDSLFIEEEYRNLRIGSTLMQRAVDWLVQQHTETQKLLVVTGNEQVLEFYKELGFNPLFITLQKGEEKQVVPQRDVENHSGKERNRPASD